MERGSRWEREAVRERWAALEHQRRTTNRLLVGATLVLTGALLFLLALPDAACTGDGGLSWECTTVTPPPVEGALVLLGAVAVLLGLWALWTVRRM